MVPRYHADLSILLFCLVARHGDGLYDSYMRTDHILKNDADTQSPPGVATMPKHTVRIHLAQSRLNLLPDAEAPSSDILVI